MGDSEGGRFVSTAEDEMAQWYKVSDYMNTHVTHYCALSINVHAGQPPRNPWECKAGHYYNEHSLCTEAMVPGLAQQIAHKLLGSEMGLQHNTQATQLHTQS